MNLLPVQFQFEKIMRLIAEKIPADEEAKQLCQTVVVRVA